MKILLLVLILLGDPDYEVEKVCRGTSYAMVVEHNSQFYVVETPILWQRSWKITYFDGIIFGGWKRLEYSDQNGANKILQVRVLSRFKWGYSGYTGALSVCRTVAQR